MDEVIMKSQWEILFINAQLKLCSEELAVDSIIMVKISQWQFYCVLLNHRYMLATYYKVFPEKILVCSQQSLAFEG